MRRAEGRIRLQRDAHFAQPRLRIDDRTEQAHLALERRGVTGEVDLRRWSTVTRAKSCSAS